MRAGVVVVAVAACGVDGAGQGIEGQLSAEGLYSDLARKDVVPDARELTPAYPLWSDGAVKRRWMIVPAGTELDTTDMDHWQLPIGGKLFKEFVVGGRRVETRMIERQGADEFRFAPFVWLPDESDAALAVAGARNVNDSGYDVPSSEECVMCHRGEPGRMLGVSAVQLAAQLEELPLSRVPERPVSIREPALGVLHGNCGHCHNPLGTAPMQTLRVSLADAEVATEETATYRTTVGRRLEYWTEHGFEMRVAPGEPEASAILYRLSQRGTAEQMPPIGTDQVDEEGRAIVRRWIASLPVVATEK